MWTIEESIATVEKTYTAITGRQAPPTEAGYAPIPAEKDPLSHVEEQLTRLLSALESVQGQTPPSAPSARWSPALSAWETETELVLCFDLPGVKREEVEVTRERHLLTVSGARQQGPLGGPGALRLAEVPLGTFRRVVALPPTAGSAEPAAQLRDGVLEVRVAKEPPRSEPAKPVRIN